MKKLDSRKLILVGVTLFSMFFGAGNLIFPPYLGYLAGDRALAAFAGFIITAVVFPVLGVTAVAKTGGLDHLCQKVHPGFALLFSFAVYLCIGPMLAIPRTTSTSYAMFAFLTDRLGDGRIMGISIQFAVSFIYSLLFFLAAGIVAKRPEKLKDRLGKRLTPILIALIVILFIAGMLQPELPVGEASGAYADGAFGTGFVEGYNTMDTLAAMVFGIVIALNIKDLGIEDNASIAKETIRGGVIAGIVLASMYGMLTFLGTRSGSLISGAQNGTEILTALAGGFFGDLGSVILAAIYFIACFNVCVGLISSCSKFFSEKLSFLSFDAWRWIITIWSFGISIMGLNTILAISTPILSIIYPVAMAVIVLNLLPFKLFSSPILHKIVVAAALLYGIYTVV